MSTSRRLPAASALAFLAAVPAAAQNRGPSTSVSPYLLPTRSLVATTSILTVNDPTSTIGGYRMVGTPDGLGVFGGTGNRLVLVMNHELPATSGSVRAGGFTGAFVSRWEIDQTTLAVASGRDHNTVPGDLTWSSQPPRALARFCSADLAAPGAYRFGTLGTDARIFLDGEESGTEGTAWAHVVSGPATNASFELPALGRFSRENSVACPVAQRKTLVVGTDDTSPGQVYVYVGTKTNTGDDVTRAGLTNGVLYGVRVAGLPLESRAAPIHGTFDLAPLGSQLAVTGAQLEAASTAAGITRFLRPEDSAWDPRPGHERELYVVTTDTLTTSGGRSRLHRLSFMDLAQPELGGAIDSLLVGTEGQEMLDNLTIDARGRILLQEDVGNNARLGKVWLYDLDSGSFGEIGQHDPALFQSGMPGFLTANEESSGIVDAASLLGPGWFLSTVMAHYAISGELAEGGQLLALYVDPQVTMPAGVDTIGAASPGCQALPAVSVQSPPRVGNGQFALRCVRAPATSAGIALFGTAGLSSPLPILGIQLWLDPSALVLTVATISDAQGQGVLALPIPASALPGGQLYSQFVWAGPSTPAPCPPLGISASNAVRITLQP